LKMGIPCAGDSTVLFIRGHVMPEALQLTVSKLIVLNYCYYIECAVWVIQVQKLGHVVDLYANYIHVKVELNAKAETCVFSPIKHCFINILYCRLPNGANMSPSCISLRYKLCAPFVFCHFRPLIENIFFSYVLFIVHSAENIHRYGSMLIIFSFIRVHKRLE